jgi:integrase
VSSSSDWLLSLDVTPSTLRAYRWALGVLAQFPPIHTHTHALAVIRALQSRLAPRSLNLLQAVIHQTTGVALKRHRTVTRTPLLPTAFSQVVQLDLAPRPRRQPRTRQTGRPLVTIRPAVATQALLGLRIGEVRGLEWRDLDLAQGMVSIRRQRLGGRVYPLKTTHAARTIPMPAALVDALTSWRQIAPDTVRVFTATARTVSARLRAYTDQLHLPPMSPHALRHGFATYMLHGGVDAVTVSHLLGHADVAFTLKTYCAVTPQAMAHAQQVAQSATQHGRPRRQQPCV